MNPSEQAETENSELKYVILSGDQANDNDDSIGEPSIEHTFIAPDEPADLYRPDEIVDNNGDSSWSSWFKTKYETTKQYVETNVKPTATRAYEKTKEGAGIAYEKTKEGAGVALEKTKEGIDSVTTYVAETDTYKSISGKIDELRNKSSKEGESQEHTEGQEQSDELVAGEIADQPPRLRKRDQLKAIIVEKVILPSKKFANYVADEVENLRQKDLEHDEELRRGRSNQGSNQASETQPISAEDFDINSPSSDQASLDQPLAN